MPWGDWQFWVVTGAFAVALLVVVRPLLPRRRGGSTCGGCASGAAARRRGRKVRLTIERQGPGE